MAYSTLPSSLPFWRSGKVKDKGKNEKWNQEGEYITNAQEKIGMEEWETSDGNERKEEYKEGKGRKMKILIGTTN